MLDKALFPDIPFWGYSLQVYGKQNVPAACLRLQENLQVDVNILLFCCWTASVGYPLFSEPLMARIAGQVAEYHEMVVKNLRVARNVLKGGYAPLPDALSATLRKHILSVEVDCEYGEQVILAQQIDHLGEASGVANAQAGAENLRTYLRYLNVRPTNADRDDLVFLISNGMPDCDQKLVREALF
ncbi:MAG: TIGR02444 family protein [Fimbriimonadaceae bacterium]|nr:TIGR02444 family protein [Alphaproteobacteria bacterium]